MKWLHEFLAEVQPIFSEAQKYNRVALGLTAIILTLLPFVITLLIGMGVHFGPQAAEAIMTVYNAGIKLAGGVVMIIALVFFVLDALSDRSPENVGRATKSLLLIFVLLVWVLAAWAIAQFAVGDVIVDLTTNSLTI
jgi:hypothetical protein